MMWRLVSVALALLLLAGAEDLDEADVVPVVLLGSRNDDVTQVSDQMGFDERQARMSLQTESPTAKARRVQAHRNILAMRRRKVVRQRGSAEAMTAAASRRSSSRRGRPAAAHASMDVLEMQESQNGLYVTVPEQLSPNDTHEIVIETLGGGTTGGSSPRRNGTTKSYRSNSSNISVGEQRKKIVAMPASLYNHFRPVESNIPIEDMSQFLYFGQKLRGTGMGKDSSAASPSPKKLLAGLEDILDDEMNSVDRSGHVSSKSTKMRTTSFREQTTRPACPDKLEAEARRNSLNATGDAQKAEEAGLGLRIVVTEAAAGAAPSSTTGPPDVATSTTTAGPTTESAVANSTSEETSKATVASRNKEQQQQQQQQQQHVTMQPPPQRQRSALRNSHESSTGGGGGSGGGSGGPITSSSLPAASRLSAGATVEQAAAPRPGSSAAAAPRQQKQPGFTIRWTDARQQSASSAVSKRRRLAAAAAAGRRRDKSARTMDEPSGTTMSTSTTTSTTAPTTTTTTATEAPIVFPVTPVIVTPEAMSSSTTTTTTTATTSTTTPTTTTTTTEEAMTETVEQETTTEELPATMTTERMLEPSEVQKMYRSGSTAKPETSTAGPTTTSTVASTEIVEETPTVTMESETSSVSGPSSTSTTASTTTTPRPSRSPEVRGRNLADKAKDDVLPIMQLYNTSSMFNASESPSTTPTTVLSSEAPAVATTTPTATTTIVEPTPEPSTTTTTSTTTSTTTTTTRRPKSERTTTTSPRPAFSTTRSANRSGSAKPHRREFPELHPGAGYYPLELQPNGSRTLFESGLPGLEPMVNVSEVISRRHDGDALDAVAVVSYILATLLVFPIAVGVGLILRRLILRNRKVLEESDTSSEISCRKDALNLETGDFKMPIEKTITKLPRIQHLCHEAEKPPPPASQESRWEFPRDKLRLQTVLGEGNFGQVWKAEADDLTGHQGTTRLVAVKTVKEGASDREKEDLVRELEIMQRVGSHPNVVTLLGCCTEQEPHYLILEYVMYGKLLAYLRDHRTRQDFYNFSEDSAALTSRDLTVFGYCVARGMEYLASKKIIHRDLAARNVLVDHNKLCKIADFGMSRFANEDGEVIETRHGRNALPIRWMAPESLIYSLFTTKTDVWSFGILMWEIVTLGSTPYPDMTAREVMRSVQSGYRLERPSHCRGELFRVIARCWHADPDRRPEFQVLRRDLAQLLEDNMNGHYVDLESFASECTD